ncbi:MAG: hypothetical protein IAX22_06570 [Candidatus Bathyarchaeota archaeon]|nr:hypothetical protein [Candidatus Bathyarchaeota archaeon]
MTKPKVSSKGIKRERPIKLSVKLPPKRVQEKFLIIYELEGCQKAVDYLTNHYKVRRMKIILDGKKVGAKKSNNWIGCYSKNKAYFTTRGLKQQVVLHELYHHLVEKNKIKLAIRLEEREACKFAYTFNEKRRLTRVTRDL